MTKNGLLSNLTEQDINIVYVDIYPPEQGEWYVVKVNFLKVETSTEAVDAYFDYLNSQKEQGGSTFWDATREVLKEVESHASLEVTDAYGNFIGSVPNLGVVTLFKKVKFQATRSYYRVKISCSQGAGLYHLVFEYK